MSMDMATLRSAVDRFGPTLTARRQLTRVRFVLITE
jgi:hypothetical protein